MTDQEIINMTITVQKSIKNIERKRLEIQKVNNYVNQLKNSSTITEEQTKLIPELESNLLKLTNIIDSAELELKETLKNNKLNIFYELAKTMNSFGY